MDEEIGDTRRQTVRQLRLRYKPSGAGPIPRFQQNCKPRFPHQILRLRSEVADACSLR